MGAEMSLRTVAILIAVAVMAGSTREVNAQDYYGVKITARNVVFLVDTSGSMEDKDEGSASTGAQAIENSGIAHRAEEQMGRLGHVLANGVRREATKMGAARRELMHALEQLPADTNFTIITFGSQVAEWPGGFRPAGTVARRAAQLHVYGINAGGDTPMRAAVQLAMGKPTIDTIFLVSDGHPTDGGSGDVLNAVAAAMRGRDIIVNTVGIGPDQDAALLCSLAEHNGGVYVRDGKVACQSKMAGPCNNPELRVTTLNDSPIPKYTFRSSPICDNRVSRRCSVDNVYKVMLRTPRAVAPVKDIGRPQSVTHCGMLILQAFGGGDNRIITGLDAAQHSVTNYTLIGHAFYPGRVIRQIAIDGNMVTVLTMGTGTEEWIRKVANKTAAPFIWEISDDALKHAVEEDLKTGNK
jgi:uncharacterized protein YegL